MKNSALLVFGAFLDFQRPQCAGHTAAAFASRAVDDERLFKEKKEKSKPKKQLCTWSCYVNMPTIAAIASTAFDSEDSNCFAFAATAPEFGLVSPLRASLFGDAIHAEQIFEVWQSQVGKKGLHAKHFIGQNVELTLASLNMLLTSNPLVLTVSFDNCSSSDKVDTEKCLFYDPENNKLVQKQNNNSLRNQQVEHRATKRR